MPPSLRTAYAAGTLTELAYLLVQATAARQAATEARRAARRADDIDTAAALDAAADALDASGILVQGAMHQLRAVIEDRATTRAVR